MTEQAPEPSRALTTRGRWLFGGSLGVAGLLLVASLVVPEVVGWTPETTPRGWAWTEAVLVNLGAAIALIAPIEWFISRLRRDVEDVEARQEQRVEEAEARQEQRVEEVREETAAAIGALQETVDSLTKLDREVAEGLDAVRAADLQQFRSVAADDTTGTEACLVLSRALKLKRISGSGVRVAVSEQRELHVVFVPMLNTTTGKHRVHLSLHRSNSHDRLGHLYWQHETPKEILVKLGTLVRDLGSDERPTATSVLGGLADALVFAEEHALARPLIQYFPPQWAMTDAAIAAPEYNYAIRHDRPDRRGMDVRAKGLTWLDFDSYDAASLAADLYFPLSAAQKGHGL
ncbi:hypothetical protein NSA53_17660 [Cellulosimicrobium cellulans]|uniref:hypothetical protein n=1 Tax=Cellulosimicrobium cellulans TaxID=1710 RepID=UPI00214A36A2|nr:hypothetical protein [Cellulosimicrobium cellulans]